jgi:cell filamentation protein
MIDVGYDAFDDPYCYKGTGVLRNKAGLRDPDALEAFELEMGLAPVATSLEPRLCD